MQNEDTKKPDDDMSMVSTEESLKIAKEAKKELQSYRKPFEKNGSNMMMPIMASNTRRAKTSRPSKTTSSRS